MLAAADGEAAAAEHEANAAEAIERSVFGSPTYFVDGDMFYGQDRLEMVLRACGRAYADCRGRRRPGRALSGVLFLVGLHQRADVGPQRVDVGDGAQQLGPPFGVPLHHRDHRPPGA